MDTAKANILWGATTVETLVRLGARYAVVSPGSRSTPLTLAFAEHPRLEAIPVLDERSAAFFALGLAQRTGLPTILVCTSGTAVANFFPALIEAHYNRVPLLVFTADRPPEMHQCSALQTIEQQNIFGKYPNASYQMALPSSDPSLLRYLRQTLVQAWEQSCFPKPGPVHLNFPFREPFLPERIENIAKIKADFDMEVLLGNVQPPLAIRSRLSSQAQKELKRVMRSTQRGLIIVGPVRPDDPVHFVEAVAELATYSGWPVLADGLSPLRNYAKFNPSLVAHYDSILRNAEWASKYRPECVFSIGSLPISKPLHTWLQRNEPPTWVLNNGPDNCDAVHRRTVTVRVAVEDLRFQFPSRTQKAPSRYCSAWLAADKQVNAAIRKKLKKCSYPFEGGIVGVLATTLPKSATVFAANSTPIRDIESLWAKNDRGITLFSNRGANGIDGTLSTALGVAHRGRPTVLLTGDLALLHDSNGFLLNQYFTGSLTIILVNNHGGGIFETLPIKNLDPPFEKFFATPQKLDFKQLALTHGIEMQRPKSWDTFIALIRKLPKTGIRLIEIETERKEEAQLRQELLTVSAEVLKMK